MPCTWAVGGETENRVDVVLWCGSMRIVPTQENFDHCRLHGHQWDEYEHDDWIPEWGVPFTEICLSCTSLRRAKCDSITGEVLGRKSIKYCKGYLYRKGEEKPTQADFRLIRLKKRLEQRREDRAAQRRARRHVNGNGRRRATA